MQAKSLKAILATLGLLLTILSTGVLAKEIVIFTEEASWGWIKEAEISDENPFEGTFSIKIGGGAGGWINHGPHDIQNVDLSEFEDGDGNLPVDKVAIEFYYDVGTADIGYWEVTFQLGGDWANKISQNNLGAELDAEEGYQLFSIPLKDFGPTGWWDTMPLTITAMQLGASFPEGATGWMDNLIITDGEDEAAVSARHKLAATWGELKSK